MLKSRLPVIFLSAVLGTAATQAADIGSRIDNFRLLDVSGREYTLSALTGRILVLVFWSYKCPVSLGYTSRIEALKEKYEGKGVTVLAVSTGTSETAAEIRANTANLQVTFPVLLDTEGDLAKSLDATHNPGVFILDREGILRYKGAFDNNRKVGDDKRIAYAEEAVNATLAGRPAAITETKAFGCNIRRQAF